MKAIVATEIRAGDTVRIREKVVLAVQATELKNTFTYEYHPKVRIIPRLGESVEVNADAIVELLRRPRPMGETEDLVEEHVASSAHLVAVVLDNALHSAIEKSQAVARLREVLDAYELGKPVQAGEPKAKGDNAGIR